VEKVKRSWADEIVIRRHLNTPLYLQLKHGPQDWITNGLEEGFLAAGQRAPSENELKEALGVSSITVRRALHELERQGLIRRIQGRGSFISEQSSVILSMEKLFSLTTLTLEKGMEPARETLELARIVAPLNIARQLDVDEGAPLVKLVRLRLMDTTPISVDTSYLPLDRFPDFMRLYQSSHSLYELMHSAFDNGPVRAHDMLQPVLISAFESQVLQVSEGSPAILVRRVAYNRDDVPIEFTKSVFRGDLCRFSIEFKEKNSHDNQPVDF